MESDYKLREFWKYRYYDVVIQKREIGTAPVSNPCTKARLMYLSTGARMQSQASNFASSTPCCLDRLPHWHLSFIRFMSEHRFLKHRLKATALALCLDAKNYFGWAHFSSLAVFWRAISAAAFSASFLVAPLPAPNSSSCINTLV